MGGRQALGCGGLPRRHRPAHRGLCVGEQGDARHGPHCRPPPGGGAVEQPERCGTGGGVSACPASAEQLRATFDLAGRTAFVTGGASGLGQLSALGLAAFGADVVLCDLDGNDTYRTASQVAVETGRRCVGWQLDVTDAGQVEDVVARVEDEVGAIDICVNSAGINHRELAADLAVDDFRRVLDVNLVGTFQCAQAVGRRMVARRSGKVINLASVLGLTGATHQAAYASSKGAVIQLTKVLAMEWVSHNVQVNALAPAHVATPLTDELTPELRQRALERIPQHRFAESHEIVAPVVFLASRASDFVTGSTLPFDGGWTAA
ncbi:MAG: SDR family oxidoreductase [Streptosporangiales bacterium]|nr:SDR family oxidoreductase [Streptosporangiales bacterium]